PGGEEVDPAGGAESAAAAGRLRRGPPGHAGAGGPAAGAARPDEVPAAHPLPPGRPPVSTVDRQQARQLAEAVAWGRIAIGVTALVAPSVPLRPWVGG